MKSLPVLSTTKTFVTKRTKTVLKKGPSNEEAFHCLETAMKWVEQQEECDDVQLLCLKRLRDLAAKKRVLSLKQKKILDFFS
ncbi:hypothetical protein C0J52_10562 [Blattella germanica]|nr:hypothetical protein C0J52_10562 [Blattella germanica]